MIGVGDKVVCVDDKDSPLDDWLYPDGPLKRGAVYTIRNIDMARSRREGRTVCLFLTGKTRIWNWNGREYGFSIRRFRKLEDYRNEQELAYYRELPKPYLIPG